MAKPSPNWQMAHLPPKTAVIAIGDIHSHVGMLNTLLDGVEERVGQLRVQHPDYNIYVVGIGDYIDRGESAPETVERLLQFKADMSQKDGVEVVYLCGNHDDCFKRLLDATAITSEPVNPRDLKDWHNALTKADGSISLVGFVEAMDSGGMITTLQNYCGVDRAFLLRAKEAIQPHADPKIKKWVLTMANSILKRLQANVPEVHKQFFDEVYDHENFRLGDFLFTHAGVMPEKSMEEQGIESNRAVSDEDRFARVMVRNPFLWRDKLENCPYVVVHGHTPTVIKENEEDQKNITQALTRGRQADRIVDPQKPYRLDIDTGVYDKGGSLTAMVRVAGEDIGIGRQADAMTFMAVNHDDPSYVAEYALNPHAMELARAQNKAEHPEFHPGGEKYYGNSPVRTWAQYISNTIGLSRDSR